ncbi:MAG: hypothetical protein ABIG44_12980 [Planctomycetota bacterium]
MARFDRFLRCSLLSAMLVAPLIGSTGCANSRFGSELEMRPKPFVVDTVEGTSFNLPELKPFSIALPSANKKAGLEGQVDADAVAAGNGTAEASASVTHGGTATGTFQLGHGFKNDTDRLTDFNFTIRFHYAFELSASPASGYPDAQVGLNLYARGPHGLLLREMTLVQHSTDLGAADREADETLHFTLALGPGDTAEVFLAGRVHSEIREGRSAEGMLKLSDVRMEVVTKPAPAVRTADHEQ